MSKQVDRVLNAYQRLNKTQQIEFTSRLSRSSASMEEYLTETRFANGRCCPHCGSTSVIKYGKRADGTQKYRCNDCHKQFNIKSNSIVAHTRMNMDIWQSFIECMLQGLSLRVTAEICGISKNTAFTWRHKVLDALQKMADDVVLDGIIEADETFFAISYKGNHKNSKTFKMPRSAHRRGGETHKRGISKEKVCVSCAVNRTGLSISKVSNLGHVTINELHSVFDGRITPSSVLCTDKMSAYKTFALESGLELHQFKADKPVKGIHNIQHINNYHSTLKGFMYPFKGVSSKYLNNYLIWHNFVHYAGETYTEKKNILLGYCFTQAKTVLRDNIKDRNPLPIL